MTKNDNTAKILRPNIVTPFNKTTNFMLAGIDLKLKAVDFKKLQYYGFINCYIDYKQAFEKKKDYLYLVFNPDQEALKSFYKLYHVYKDYPNFVTDYSIDYNLIVVVFKVKDKWRNSYNMFKQSKYSKMSSEFARLYRSVEADQIIEGAQYLVITKQQVYKKHLEEILDVTIDNSAELMDPLDNREIFDYERVA